MLKGKSVIELTNVHTGEKEVYEDTNLVTEAIADVLNTNIQGMMYDSPSFDGKSGDDWLLPVYERLTGGILLYQNAITEDPTIIYAPLDNPLIGYASSDANNTADTKRGSRNLTESKKVDNSYKYVWDFATSQANGTISCICLTNSLAGKGTQVDSNYFVMLRGDTVKSGISDPDRHSYQDNQRPYIGDGFRMEMISVYNTTAAILRKIPEDYIHAKLLQRTYSLIATDAVEETSIELNHYPYWVSYSGGSKDGTNAPYYNYDGVLTYLFHGADGNWYGISRKDNQKYSSTSNGVDYYYHDTYEWFLDTISAGKGTTQKIILPANTQEIRTVGMSGKWLMFALDNSTTVYRLDTTNVANIEVVPDATYNSSNSYTFNVDDDVVINGWYYLNGEPKLYVRNLVGNDYVSWGRKHLSRYKTYAYQEYYCHYSDYYFHKDLYLYTPYLATINNLATPVIKTADKTMKITYTLTETAD